MHERRQDAVMIRLPRKRRASTYAYTDTGGKKENEDTAHISVQGKNMVAVIADGLGGQGDGKAASELAVRSLSECGVKGGLPDEEELMEAFRAANHAVMEKQTNKFHMKTTAVYLCIHKLSAIWAHVGDSRLYHFWNGELVHYTLDHSVSQMAVALGEITREEIPRYPQRSRLLRALGSEGEEADVHQKIQLEEGQHAFLLCTDGFWEYLEESEIPQVLGQSKTAEMWVEELRSRVESRCGTDNDNNTAIAIILEV